MSEEEVSVIKSPIVPTPDYGEQATLYDELVYYVYLANGIVATKPEDFPSDDEKTVEEEPESPE